ncbi:four-carbon acid sugar kinase family protein [Paenibacillus ginsengihumi]|uniref:four-carbon acid sugar kinase family protein n=1 Tax=Paenibacillus ginsengihumi TaxID=431596 RepID=UPI00037FDE33|nr:four-carbon acid sugar kinase family protein [Paenibacillus ginsengihumi]
MRICYYGDDFTGSTDALEALAAAGLRVILFMDVPDPAVWKERFADYDGFGVAGVSRTMSPAAMERELPPVLSALRAFGAPITHYKICSTFDSSPDIGSIGKVIELGRQAFPEQRCMPVVAGLPVLKRYTVFGNHFVGAEGVRLDRHPNTANHPVTPMQEADLRVHLGRQTALPVGLMSVLDLELDGAELERRFEHAAAGHDIVLFDVLSEAHLAKIGALLSRLGERGPAFAVGSSGVEYALAAHWRSCGLLPSEPPRWQAGSAERLLVVSGSCSPVTRAQIEWALAHGYAGMRIPADCLLADGLEAAQPLLAEAKRLLRDGRSVILYTALGPDDDGIAEVRSRLRSRAAEPAASGQRLGARLGDLAKELITSAGLTRAVIAGGDTSGFAVQRLGGYALEMKAPLVPGAPLCRVLSRNEQLDGLELVLKGGQVGPPDMFERVRTGRA